MSSSRKCVQYVQSDGRGCHKVPRLPFSAVRRRSCLQTEGWDCSNAGLSVQCPAVLPSALPVQKFHLSPYRIYILNFFQSVKQPYSDSASPDTIVLCSSGSVCKCTEDTQKKKKKTVYRTMPHTNLMSICYCVC